MSRAATVLVDLALAPAVGDLGATAMEPVSMWLYERDSDKAKRRRTPCVPVRRNASRHRRRLGASRRST